MIKLSIFVIGWYVLNTHLEKVVVKEKQRTTAFW
jgi:hypothetical protein